MGLWEGRDESDICSSLTKVDAHHWANMSEACHDLVDRKVTSSLVGLGIVLAATTVYNVWITGVRYITQRSLVSSFGPVDKAV